MRRSWVFVRVFAVSRCFLREGELVQAAMFYAGREKTPRRSCLCPGRAHTGAKFGVRAEFKISPA